MTIGAAGGRPHAKMLSRGVRDRPQDEQPAASRDGLNTSNNFPPPKKRKVLSKRAARPPGPAADC